MAVHAASNALINAGVAIGVAAAAVWILRQIFSRRGRRIAEAVTRGELTPEADTRLRLIQRLLYAVVITIGVASALSQFEEVKTIGRTVLASGAIAAAVIGFAARQTLANIVAGIMIAITQPVRVGDWVGFDEDYGVVEDITLNFTTLRTLGGRRIVIPNEKMASSVLKNDSLREALVAPDVSLWLPPEADAARAAEVLREQTGHDVAVAEAVPWGTRLALGGDPVDPARKGAVEAELRAAAVARLRAEGLLQAGSPPATPN